MWRGAVEVFVVVVEGEIREEFNVADSGEFWSELFFEEDFCSLLV